MADSDDESDRRYNRDRFRRERSDYDNRRTRPGDKREPFEDKLSSSSALGRAEKRSYDTGRHTSSYESNSHQTQNNRSPHSPQREPPYKRTRRYDDNNNNANNARSNAGGVGRRDYYRGGNASYEDESCYRPPLVTFKRFLDPLDDTITEENACKKYKEYKETYHKKHIEDYFEAHKSEEWLRLRYHPDHIDAHKARIAQNLKHRLEVFMDLFDKGYMTGQVVQMDNSEKLIQLMDAVVVKLEGGSDADLAALMDKSSDDRHDDSDADVGGGSGDRSSDKPVKSSSRGAGGEEEEGEALSDSDVDDDEVGGGGAAAAKSPVKEEAVSPSSQPHTPGDGASSITHDNGKQIANDELLVDDQMENGAGGEDDMSAPDDGDVSNHDEDDEAVDSDVPTPTTAEAPDNQLDCEIAAPLTPPVVTDTQASEVVAPPEDVVKPSWPLHKTASIFFRSLPATVTESELTQLCSSQPGFLRLALWDPVPERYFKRHAWATYQPTVNIKKVCWELNNNHTGLSSPLSSKLPTTELGASVNRDLAQRVRPLTPVTRHRPVMLADLDLAARLVARLDASHGLWNVQEDGKEAVGDDDAKRTASLAEDALQLALRSSNPLLLNLADYLVDEGASEEQALLDGIEHAGDIISATDNNDAGRGRPSAAAAPVVNLESDASLAQALDHIILYLRVVYSLDFYAGTIYPMEDLMPHKCGILHARGDRGLNAQAPGRPGLLLNQREVEEYMRNFSTKIRALVEIPADLTDEEMTKMGKRDPEKAGEDFVEANIQKRTGKKKPFKVVWVCPLSDKKFREPIFVRKHILNKYMDRVEEAKKEALFFNGYLRDPKRPCLPEAPPSLGGQNTSSYRGGGGGGGYQQQRGPPRSNNFRGGSNYRSNGPPPSNALLPTAGGFNRNTAAGGSGGSYHDYYDLARSAASRQPLAAVAAAAAAALCPGGDLANLALSTAQRVNTSRQSHYSRRPMRGNDRSMVSYTDLDDPGGPDGGML